MHLPHLNVYQVEVYWGKHQRHCCVFFFYFLTGIWSQRTFCWMIAVRFNFILLLSVLQRGQSGLFMWACFIASLIFIHHGTLDVNHQCFGAAQQSCFSLVQKIFLVLDVFFWTIHSFYRCHLLTVAWLSFLFLYKLILCPFTHAALLGISFVTVHIR